MVLTDNQTFTIDVISSEGLEISNVTYPDIVNQNEPFIISYRVTNKGSNNNCCGRIIDNSIPMDIYGSRWQENISYNEYKDFSVDILGININLDITIEVGVYE